jgi:hypothetical protein
MPNTSRSGKKSRNGTGGDPVLATCLPAWVARSLANGGIRRLSQLTGWKDAELLQLRGIGPRSVELIRTALRHARKSPKSRTTRQ